MQNIQITPHKTDKFEKPGTLLDFIANVPNLDLQNGDVLTISTKIVSIDENRFVKQSDGTKKDLVEKESDHYLGEISYDIHLTIKHGLFIPSAGIDASNAGTDEYLLYPVDPFASAKKIWNFLKDKFNLEKLGVVLVDSHTTPLRRGTTGIALGYWGFSAVKDYRGKPDVFGEKLQYTFSNLLDGLAVMGNFCMGEGDEQQPIVVVRGAELEFSDTVDPSEVKIPPKEDLYYPIFKKLMD